MLLMIRAFSRNTQLWHLYRVSVSFVTGYTGFCPSAVQPLEIRGRSDAQNHHESTQGSQQQMIHRLMIAPTNPPVSQACGRFSVSSKLCYTIITPSGKNRNGLTYIALERGTAAHFALRSRNSQRDRLHGCLSTRREIYGGIGKHSKLPPDIRRRPMHSIEGALV